MVELFYVSDTMETLNDFSPFIFTVLKGGHDYYSHLTDE